MSESLKNRLNPSEDSNKSFFKNPTNVPIYEESRNSALLGLFFYSGLMFTIPLLVFFGSKQILEDNYDLEPPWNLLWPAILSIVSVNLIIVAYIIKGFQEVKKERETPHPKSS